VLGFLGALIGVLTGAITLASQLGAFGDFRVPFLPGKSVAATASLSLSTGQGPSGTLVTVSGTGFDGGEKVTIRFHVEQVGDALADNSGAFSAAVKVPGSYDAFAPQQFEFIVTGNASARSATVSFRLTLAAGTGPAGGGPAASNPNATASISLSVGSGRSGTPVTVTGQNFAPGEEVTIRFQVDEVGSAIVDSGGRFSTRIRIPGSYDVFAPKQFDISADGKTSIKHASRPFQLTR